MAGFLRDLRFGLRALLRAPGFTAAAVLALGLGTGAATAIFSVLNGVVLRPLPYSQPDRLVMLWETNQEKHLEHEPLSPVNFLDYRNLGQVFVDAAAWWRPELTLTQPGQEPIRLNAVEASRNLFTVLGVKPLIGPGFERGGVLHTRVLDVVISDRLWRARFDADPSLIGGTIALDGVAHEVVGIMPPGFTYPGDTDVWEGLTWDLAQHSRAAHFMEAVARLAPGATRERADAELAALTTRLRAEFPATNRGWSARATPLLHEVVGYFRVALYTLMGASALLLLIACVNVANLLLARATARERELAVRTAIGANRGRLVRQLFAESLLLGVLGAALGLLVAWAAITAFVAETPVPVPRLHQVALDARVLAFAAGLAILTAVIFGLAPAVVMSRGSLHLMLKEGARAGGAPAARRIRDALVVGEIALAVALLVGAGLLVRSVERLVSEDPGLRPSGILTVSVQVPQSSYRDWTEVIRFYEGLLDDLRARPDVEAASATSRLPLTPGWRIPFLKKGEAPPRAGEAPMAQYHTVGTGYFDTLGVPLLRGRMFDARDTLQSPGVVVVNQSLARRYWPGGEPIGARIRALTKVIGPLGIRLADSDEYEVLGVVGDVRNQSLQQETEPAIYFTIAQFPFRQMFLTVRGQAAGDLLSAVRETLRQRDPTLPLSQVRTMGQVLAESSARPRLLMWLLSAFAALALVLAAVGIYGILAYAVNERRREIGIRLALGAQTRGVVWMVVRQGLTLAAIGALLGGAGAWVAGRSLTSLLFRVSATDPLTFATVVGLMLVVALAACYVPGRRAARLDPLEALRVE
jgi:putative ABC transport system permease protein